MSIADPSGSRRSESDVERRVLSDDENFMISFIREPYRARVGRFGGQLRAVSAHKLEIVR
jgi:hypothetical protein